MIEKMTPKTNSFRPTYPNIPDGFVEMIRKARLDHGLTLQKAVDQMGGVSVAVLNQYEVGTRNIPYDKALMLKEFYELEIDLPEPIKFRRRGDVTKQAIKDGSTSVQKDPGSSYLFLNCDRCSSPFNKRLGVAPSIPEIIQAYVEHEEECHAE